MRKIVVSEFISLDGVIQAPGGAGEDTDGGFTHGGWTHAYWDDEIGIYFDHSLRESSTFLLGRKTWQIHSIFETMEGDPFFDMVNALQKRVVSNTLENTKEWRNSTLIRGTEIEIVEQIRQLKAEDGKNILIDGSSVLIHTLVQHDLIDEYNLWVYPLVLGEGKRLFPAGTRSHLKLIEVRPLETGVTLLRYVPQREA